MNNPDPLLERLNAEFKNETVPAQSNPAVAFCCRVTMMVYSQARQEGDCDRTARTKSGRAFRLAMPLLIGKRNIRDFIACTTHGLLLQLIPKDEAGKLLYAAQVAQRACRARTDDNTKKGKRKAVSGDKTAVLAPSEAI